MKAKSAARDEGPGRLLGGHRAATENAQGHRTGAQRGIKVADVDALVAKLLNWESHDVL
jgi:hypothetical protein